jgi:hypothetical protein
MSTYNCASLNESLFVSSSGRNYTYDEAKNKIAEIHNLNAGLLIDRYPHGTDRPKDAHYHFIYQPTGTPYSHPFAIFTSNF